MEGKGLGDEGSQAEANPGQSTAGSQQAPRALLWATGDTFHLACCTRDSWHLTEIEFEEDEA